MRAGGFTLVELLVALAVVGLVMVATLTILQQGQEGYALGVARLEAQQSARVALERVAREVRTAGFDPAGTGFPAIVNPAPTSLTIQKDLNGNGVIDAAAESVTYLLRGTTLRRNAGGGAQPVIEGVEDLTFTYLDAGGAPTTLPAAIRTVIIALTVTTGSSPSVAHLGTRTASMRTQVRLRNR